MDLFEAMFIRSCSPDIVLFAARTSRLRLKVYLSLFAVTSNETTQLKRKEMREIKFHLPFDASRLSE
jgi:hypothetical protein